MRVWVGSRLITGPITSSSEGLGTLPLASPRLDITTRAPICNTGPMNGKWNLAALWSEVTKFKERCQAQEAALIRLCRSDKGAGKSEIAGSAHRSAQGWRPGMHGKFCCKHLRPSGDAERRRMLFAFIAYEACACVLC